MSFNYAKMQKTANKLIDKFGFMVKLEKPGKPTGPEHDPIIGPPEKFDIRVVQDYTDVRDQNGTLIRAHARRLMMGANGPIPETVDRIEIEGRWHEIEIVTPEAPGGEPIYYYMVMRT